MYQAIGVIETKSIARGIEATDTALKSAGVTLVSSHAACPGKYEIILSGGIADVTAACDTVRARYEDSIIQISVMGRIDPQVIKALFGTQSGERGESLGIVETFSAAAIIKAADLAVKTAKVDIYDLRVSRGMGGKGVLLVTGAVGDVTAAVEAGREYAAKDGLFANCSVIAAPHAELWQQL